MTDEEKVKAKWPDAHIREMGLYSFVVYKDTAPNWLGVGMSKWKAWQDAARRIEEASSER